jgi:hypothetical protein
MLIALYSPAPQCGKSTIADHLVTEHGFTRLSFAEPLKAMAGTLLGFFGYSPQDAFHMTHAAKEAPLPEIDRRITSRQLQRTLGTEWGRDCIHTDIWLRCWASRYLRLCTQAAGTRVVVDDMRFLNEALLMQRFDALLWKVERPGVDISSTHRSDGDLNHLKPLSDPENDYSVGFDHLFINDGSVDELLNAVDGTLTPFL